MKVVNINGLKRRAGLWLLVWLIALPGLLLAACAQAPSPTATPAPAKAPPTAGTQAPAATAAKPAATQPAPAATSKPAATQKVRLGGTGVISDGPFYIAMEKGYFKEAGVDIDLTPFASAGDAMAPLAAGQLDVVGGGINVGTFNAVLRGTPLTVVANRAYLTPGFDGDVWMIRSDLVDKIKNVSDLKGRKIAVNSPTSPNMYMIGKTLEKAGLKMDDIELVTLGFPDMVTAFQNGAIDATIEVEPFVARAEEMGVAKVWMEISQVIGPLEVGDVFYNTDWAKKDRTLAVNFLAAFLKGAREYYDAMNHGSNRAEVVGILTKHGSIKEAALFDKMRWIGLNPDGYMDIPSVQDQIDWYKKRGDYTENLSANRVIDQSFLDEALKKVGPYKK